MKGPSIRRAVLSLSLLGAIGLSFHFLFPTDPERTFISSPPTHWSHIRGYGAGMRWAVADLVGDRAYILMTGLPGPGVDRQTGLALRSTGCVTSDGIEAVVAGYNRTVTSYVRLFGSPRYSLKRWENIIFDLIAYYDNRAKTESPLSLDVDGPPIIAPDGRTRVWLRSHRDSYILAWDPDLQNVIWPRPRDGALKCFIGPPGSNFLVLRGIQGKAEITAAFDLRYGFLRYEPENY